MPEQKMHVKRLSRQGRLYSSLLEQGREARMQSDLNSAETKVGEFIIVENLDLKKKRSKLSPIYITSGSFTTWNRAATKGKFLLCPSPPTPSGTGTSVYYLSS